MLHQIKKLVLFLFFSFLSLSTTAQALSYTEVTELLKKSVDLQKSKKYAEARDILIKILPFATGRNKEEAKLGIPVLWYQEANGYAMVMQHNKAQSCYLKAYEGFHELGHKKYELLCIKAVADISRNQNKTDEVLSYYTQCIHLAQETGNETIEMNALIELYKLYSNVGEYELSHTYEVGMDQLYSKSKSPSIHFEYMIFKGDIADARRNTHLALQWYRNARQIAETSEDLDISYAYVACIKLRDLLTQTEEYCEALEMAYKVLRIDQKNNKKDNADYYLSYMGIVNIYDSAGLEAECFEAIDSLFQCEHLNTHPDVIATIYGRRGMSHSHFKNYEAARKDYLYADQILAQKYPQINATRVNLLALLGGVEYQLEHYEKAEDYYQRYEKAMLELHGPESLPYIRAKIYLANAEGFAGHIDAGCRNYSEADRLLRKRIKKNWPLMTTLERQAYWENISVLFTRMTPYTLKAERTNDAFTQDCYNALLLSKGFLLDSERTLSEVVSKYGSSTDKDDYMQLSLMRAQSKAWERNYQLYADSILQISIKIDQLARNLSKRFGRKGDHTNYMDIDYNQIKQVLQPREVVIDFADFVTMKGEHKYVAYVITSEQKYPHLIPLFDESIIDTLKIARPDMYYYKDNAAHLIKLIWEPLSKHIPQGTNIYYIPTQLLFQISLESLPLEDGTLLGNHYQFRRLSSAREIVRMKTLSDPLSSKTAILFGGLNYDTDMQVMEDESKKYDLSNMLVLRSSNFRGNYLFHDLKGTMDEVEKIDSILGVSQWLVTSRTRHEGTEESFLSMNGCSPRYLHLATHGFYYNPQQAQEVAYLKGYEDAMQLSGLVLSGGNAAWSGKKLPKGVLGGILTAETISRLDLRNTEMVVLSACKTGQGNATEEGLYGLQRAFKKAGVQTLVMTLWNIEDNVAKDFMTTFYEKLNDTEFNGDKHKAFEDAKNVIRERFPTPFHWAAFIMVD